MRRGSNQDLMKVLDGLDEVRLPQDEVQIVRLVDRHCDQFHRGLQKLLTSAPRHPAATDSEMESRAIIAWRWRHRASTPPSEAGEPMCDVGRADAARALPMVGGPEAGLSQRRGAAPRVVASVVDAGGLDHHIADVPVVGCGAVGCSAAGRRIGGTIGSGSVPRSRATPGEGTSSGVSATKGGSCDAALCSSGYRCR